MSETQETEVMNEALPLIKYSVTDSALEELKSKHEIVEAKDYKGLTAGIAECRELRVDIEKHRILIKKDSLEYGRKIDAEAKRITASIELVEQPMKDAKAVIDDEKARVKAEKEEAERKELQRIENEKRAKEEAERKEIQRIENEKLKAEQDKLAAERKEHELMVKMQREAEETKQAKAQAERAKLQRIEDEKNVAERKKLDELRAELQRQKDEIASKEAAKLREEREEDRRAQLERIAKEDAESKAERLEAVKPELEKLADFGLEIGKLHGKLSAIDLPELRLYKNSILDLLERAENLTEEAH